jgi:pimeloyl-ACP methyl ester carboxylesterase
VGRACHAADDARRALLSPVGIRGAALETAWVAGHLAMYPFGVAEERTLEMLGRMQVQDLPPVQRSLVVSDVEAAGTPILLLHGVVDNRSIFTVLRRGLRRRGFGVVASFNYNSLFGDVRRVAVRLGEVIDEVCEDTGYERIHVIGHSMGGLIARYYVQRLGGDERVHTLVTLGAPHAGTFHARLVPHPLVRQLRPGSDVIEELAAPVPACRTRFVAIWSDLDQMVFPKQSGKITHPDLNARNVLVRGVGHLSLPVDGRVVHEIGRTLAHLDHDGHTLAVGATSITSSPARRRTTPAARSSAAPRSDGDTRSYERFGPATP